VASGNTLCVWTVQANQPPASNYATLDTRNGLWVLDFDASTDEAAVFVGILPQHYAGSGITVYLHWLATSATSGDVVWTTAFERHQAGTDDSDADSFATANSATATTAATSGSETITSIAHTNGAQLDSLAAGERFRLKVTRDADNGADTMSGDAELVAIELRES
jgi:hypothetical protein